MLPIGRSVRLNTTAVVVTGKGRARLRHNLLLRPTPKGLCTSLCVAVPVLCASVFPPLPAFALPAFALSAHVVKV